MWNYLTKGSSVDLSSDSAEASRRRTKTLASSLSWSVLSFPTTNGFLGCPQTKPVLYVLVDSALP